jgi:G3E family GTPase
MGGLHTMSRLDTTVTVIDAFNLLSNFDTTEFLSDRYERDDVVPEDERTISDLMVDQIEFADVLIINKIETVDQTTRDRISQLIKLLNPDAKVLMSNYCQVDVREIVATDRFDFMRAASGAGWLRSLHEMAVRQTGNGERMAPKPETLEYVPTQTDWESIGANNEPGMGLTILCTLLGGHFTRVVYSLFSMTSSSFCRAMEWRKMRMTIMQRKTKKMMMTRSTPTPTLCRTLTNQSPRTS